MNKLQRWFEENGYYILFAISAMGVVASLYFSEVLGFPPCNLCWWQRIFMYPVALISLVAIIRKDAKAFTYILPLGVLGLLTSIYHNLLYFGVIPEKFAPCQVGVSCLTKHFEIFGFITIPFLSLMGFVVIVGTAVFLMRGKK